MKTKIVSLLGICASLLKCYAQGFSNLGFESANVSGGGFLPIATATPGWSGYYSSTNGVVPATAVAYNGLSLGGAVISIINSNSGYSPLQGRYSLFLFGGGPNSPAFPSTDGVLYAATITQTGLVPAGTASLLIDVYAWYGFTVTLGGQDLTVLPQQVFPTFTRFGVDISTFAGQTAQLTITAPPLGIPNGVLVDNIQFSSQPIPEPSVVWLSVVGLGVLWMSRTRHR